MAEERIVVFNLRKKAVRTPRHTRSEDTMSILRREAAKLSKNGVVTIGNDVNENVWRRGTKDPELRMRLKVITNEDGSVRLEKAE